MERNKYYTDSGYVSNSMLKCLPLNPAKAKKHYDCTLDESSTAYQDLGTLVHLFLLEPQKFEKSIGVLEYELPNSAAKKKFCSEFLRLKESLENDIALVGAYRESYTTSEDIAKVLKKAQDLKAEHEDYLYFLEKSKEMTVITPDIYKKLVNIKNSVMSHKLANELLMRKQHILDDCIIAEEFDIRFNVEDIDCKSLLDKVIINEAAKRAEIIDLKTTFTPDKFISEVIDEYKYVQQLAFYKLALSEYLKKTYPEIEFEIDTYIVAVSTGDSCVTQVIKIGKTTLEKKLTEVHNLIQTAKYHIESGNWEYSKEYYTGEGYELFGKD